MRGRAFAAAVGLAGRESQLGCNTLKPAGRGIALLCLATQLAGCDSYSQTSEQTAAASAAALAGEGAADWRKPGIAGCAITAMSIESDPSGLNVHAGPSAQSKVLGKLVSLVEAPRDEQPLPSDPMAGPNFTIVAVNGDWVRIADIAPVTEGFDKTTRKFREERNHQGLGWVHQDKVMVSTGYWDKAYDRPYHQAGPWRSVDDDAGVNLYPWADHGWGKARILACDKDWVKLRYPRIATKVAGPENVRKFSPAEREKFPPIEGWLKSAAHTTSAAPCDPADPDCKARRAHDWD